MKLAVVGASGQLGKCLVEHLAESYDVIATYNTRPCAGIKLDVTDSVAFRSFLDTAKPDIVIQSAALTDLERCEKVPRDAHALNVSPLETLAAWSRDSRAKIVLISTDGVFDGTRGKYVEHDAPNPINVYGTTKLLAENALQTVPDALILRVAVLYSPDLTSKKYLANTITNLRAGKEVRGVTDMIRAPTLTDDIAEAVRGLLAKDARGIYHATGATSISMYDAARTIARVFGFDAARIIPMTRAEILIDGRPSIVRRPVDCSMEIDKLARECIRMRTFEEGLRYVKARI